MHAFLSILHSILIGVDVLIAVWLIYIVAIQESKNDGLQGQIGSKTQSAFKGKAGKEEKLNEWTRNSALLFFGIAIIIALLGKKLGG